MFCSSCGNKVNDGARFCAHCGNPVAAVKPVVPDAPAVSDTPVVPDVELTAAQESREDIENVPVVESVGAIEDVDIEESAVSLESTVSTELDPETEALLETPDIPESEIVFDDEEPKEEPAAVVAEEPKEEPAAVVAEESKEEPAAVVAEEPKVEPVVVAPEAPVKNPEPVATPVSPIPAEKPPKKIREAFKFFSFIGAIATIAGCFLELHTFKDYNGDVLEPRIDKFYEFSYGQIVIVLMAITVILLLCKLSSFAFGTILASIVSYGLFVTEWYVTQWSDILSERDFSLGIGSFVIWAGLILSLFGLFIKFGKKPLFKI